MEGISRGTEWNKVEHLEQGVPPVPLYEMFQKLIKNYHIRNLFSLTFHQLNSFLLGLNVDVVITAKAFTVF